MWRVIDAAERMSSCDLRERLFYLRYPLAWYHCRQCGWEISFCTNDFWRHLNSGFTNLSDDDAAAAVRVSAEAGVSAGSFLDFYCPSCRAAVRLYYEGESLLGSRWGSWGYRLRHIMERKRDS